MNKPTIRVSESVCEGHPDKLADQISDAILDEHLKQDPESRVAVETLVTDGLIVLAGEISSYASIDLETVARSVASEVGYTSQEIGLDASTCEVSIRVQRQAVDIAASVDAGGAGDQGMMFGYATDETPESLPMPIAIAHAVTRQAATLRRTMPELGLRPDGKCQVSVRYEGSRPVAVDSLVVSLQHDPGVASDLLEIVRKHVLGPVFARCPQVDFETATLYVNPAGLFTVGGPGADTGLTGRKIVVDTYGGALPHGGGAFSGKDWTKVDRSAAYMARYLAQGLVKEDFGRYATVCLAYAIGLSQPVALQIELASADAERLATTLLRDRFDLSPRGISEHLGLRRPIFRETARNGHFGKRCFSWERPWSINVSMTAPPVQEENGFEALCRLAASEQWCWNLGCTTCGHGLFREALHALAEGHHPADPGWSTGRRTVSPCETAFRDPWRGRMPHVRVQWDMREVMRRASLQRLYESQADLQWLGYLGLALYYTEQVEETDRLLTIGWAPQLQSLVATWSRKGESSPSYSSLQSILRTRGFILRWRDLAQIEKDLTS